MQQNQASPQQAAGYLIANPTANLKTHGGAQ